MDIFGFTTSRGVLRFDGVKVETMEEVLNGAIRNNEADTDTALAGRPDYVWWTAPAARLLLSRDRKVTAFPFDRRSVTASLTNGMVEDLDGSLWVRAPAGLYHLNDLRSSASYSPAPTSIGHRENHPALYDCLGMELTKP